MSAPVTYPPHYPASQIPTIVTPYPGPIHPLPSSSLLGLSNNAFPQAMAAPNGAPQGGNAPGADQFSQWMPNSQATVGGNGYSTAHAASGFAQSQGSKTNSPRAIQPKFGFLPPDCGIISIPATLLACCCCCAMLIVGGVVAGLGAVLKGAAK